jgi:hypothetical protein
VTPASERGLNTLRILDEESEGSWQGEVWPIPPALGARIQEEKGFCARSLGQ